MPGSFSNSANYSASTNSATKHGKGGAGEGTTRVVYKTSRKASCLQHKKKPKGNKRDRGRGCARSADGDGSDGELHGHGSDGGASAAPVQQLSAVEILCVTKELDDLVADVIAGKVDADADLASATVAGPMAVYRPRGLRKGDRATKSELVAIFNTDNIHTITDSIVRNHIAQKVAAAKAGPKSQEAWAAAGNTQWAGSGLGVLHQKYWSLKSHHWMSVQRKDCVLTVFLSAARIANTLSSSSGAGAAVVEMPDAAAGAGGGGGVSTAGGCAAILGLESLEGTCLDAAIQLFEGTDAMLHPYTLTRAGHHISAPSGLHATYPMLC